MYHDGGGESRLSETEVSWRNNRMDLKTASPIYNNAACSSRVVFRQLEWKETISLDRTEKFNLSSLVTEESSPQKIGWVDICK